MEFTAILFYIFAFMSVISALFVISVRNPVYAVLWLIFAFFNSAGLFVLLGAEMLAMLLVIVYVGAVAVLFLFVVMMLNIKTASLRKTFAATLPLGLTLATILFLEIALVVYGSSQGFKEVEVLSEKQEVAGEDAQSLKGSVENKIEEVKAEVESKVEELAGEVVEIDKKIVETAEGEEEIILSLNKNEEAEKDSLTKMKREVNKETNAHKIGQVLYTEYVLVFQLSGLILFVAMIGAIVLTLRDRTGVRKQVISKQYERNAKNAIEIVKVESGRGIG